MQWTLQVRNALELADAYRRAPAIVEKWLQKAINQSVQEVFKHATRDNLPWLTGRLTRSFGEGIEIGRLYGLIGPTVDYALKVHEHSSKPNYMPRIMALAQPQVTAHFDDAMAGIVNELS